MTDIPKGLPWTRTLDAQRDKQSLWDRLFGNSGDMSRAVQFVCGTGTRSNGERGRER